MKSNYKELNRKQHFIKASGEERKALLKFLKNEGFNIDDRFTEEEILSSPFPVAIDMERKKIHILGGAAIAGAAAASGAILTTEEFYDVYVSRNHENEMTDKRIVELWNKVKDRHNTQELVDAFEEAHVGFVAAEDEEYDYEENTEEYKRACFNTDEWYTLWNYLERMVHLQASKENLLDEAPKGSTNPNDCIVSFMDKYGYEPGGGWWFRKEK